MNKPITWFEIPTENIEDAQKFYECVFSIQMTKEKIGTSSLAVFPYDRSIAVGGALINGPGYQPGVGPVLYLNAADDLDGVIERALAGGAKLAQPKTALPPGMGFFAHIVDLDGNKIGLHGAK